MVRPSEAMHIDLCKASKSVDVMVLGLATSVGLQFMQICYSRVTSNHLLRIASFSSSSLSSITRMSLIVSCFTL